MSDQVQVQQPGPAPAWVWRVLRTPVEAFNGATAAVSAHASPLVQGAAQGAITLASYATGAVSAVGQAASDATLATGQVLVGAAMATGQAAADVAVATGQVVTNVAVATGQAAVATGQAAMGAAVATGQVVTNVAIATGQAAVATGQAAMGAAVATGQVVKNVAMATGQAAVATGQAAMGAAVATGQVVTNVAVATGQAAVGAAIATGQAAMATGQAVARGARIAGMAAVEQGGGTGLLLANKALQLAAQGTILGAQANAAAGGMPDDVIDDLEDLHEHASRLTVVGRLPNAPGFDDALQEKSQVLDQQFNAVLGQLNPASPEHVALTAVDAAFLPNAQQQQGGQAKTLTTQDFHAALLLGAHFTKPGANLYNQLSAVQNPGFQARGSSHYPGAGQQFGMDLPGGLGHLLIGLTPNGDTFFQLESHGLGNPNQGKIEKLMEKIGHTMAYVQHISGDVHYVQIGPGGCISGSEKDGQHVALA